MANVKPIAVKRLEDAANQPRAIDNWISSITSLHRDKPPQHVQYTARMPEIDALMQEWPPAFEQALATVELPSADLNVSLKEYTSIVCGLRRFLDRFGRWSLLFVVCSPRVFFLLLGRSVLCCVCRLNSICLFMIFYDLFIYLFYFCSFIAFGVLLLLSCYPPTPV